MSTEKFIQGQMYELVDKEGFQKRSIIYLPLVLEIMTTGRVIVPIIVDAFGNIMGVEFGDGTVDINANIWTACRQYFREVDPLPAGAMAMIPPHILKQSAKEPLAA